MKNENKKQAINWGNTVAYLSGRFLDGLRAIPGNPLRLLLVALYWALAALYHCSLAASHDILSRLFLPVSCVLSVLLFVALVTASAIPMDVIHIANGCRRIGLVNSCGEPPLPIRRYRNENGRLVVEVFTQGIPLSTFKERTEELEAALNYRVTKIKQGENRQIIRLHLAPGDREIPQKAYLPKDLKLAPSQVAVGESTDGVEIVDFNNTPHYQAGGASGCGKTTLLITIIYQLLKKVDELGRALVDVYLMDMKRGQDYPPAWRNRCCSLCTTAEDVLSVLGWIVVELERRLDSFADVSRIEGVPCSNLDTFNRLRPGNQLRRIVIVFDELAELTDTTGMEKPHKEMAAKIVGKMAIISRLGRAVGVNMVIGMQRGDMNTLSGQVKANISAYCCGFAGPVLSEIILGNRDADKLIPKGDAGLFLNQDGVLFRGYIVPGLEVPDKPKTDTTDTPDTTTHEEGGTNEHDHPGNP